MSKKVLFLCTGNSARRQMAEGLAREMGWDAYSAGTEPKSSVHPFAIAVMKEKGIDISHQQPKTIDLGLDRQGKPPYERKFFLGTVSDPLRDAPVT
ncbi:MAG: arsenate reductase ArsC [Armatimonadota bacterium]|nr:arsenate reductase ArsC [Armatimonadota bacterium]